LKQGHTRGRNLDRLDELHEETHGILVGPTGIDIPQQSRYGRISKRLIAIQDDALGQRNAEALFDPNLVLVDRSSDECWPRCEFMG
jgi:hypothetical protein